MVDEQGAVWAPRPGGFTRRRFLMAGAAGAVVASGGYAVVRAMGSGSRPAVGRFRSRPDLSPPLVEVLSRSPEATTDALFLAPWTGPG
ncbi:MAG TPA: hypothetical protein VM390_11120, partial [Acidimicrobiales bacterium]|nr:hypothetical protein [Acidimicrobiales bacterium]